MKTVLVIFSNDVSDIESTGFKKYAFNTEAENIEVGDKLKSTAYVDGMIVTNVLNKKFEYFNKGTGELTEEFNSANSFKIKTLKIVDVNDEEIVVSRKLID